MFQCSGQSFGSSVSQIIGSEAAVRYADMNTLELDPQFHIKQIPCFCCHMAMTTPHHQRRQWYWYGLQLEMTHFMWPYRHETITKTCHSTQQNDQLKWLPIVVAIATDHVFTSNTESPCFCCYWQFLTTNGAGIWLQLIRFILTAGVHSVRNVTVATSTSLPSPRRSYRGHCHPGQPYHVHILCIWVLYQVN